MCKFRQANTSTTTQFGARVRNLRAGFTLIETLLAILVLTVSIAGPLTIASRGLNAALVAKDQTVAFYLAQDAMEFVRYRRDTNVLTDSTRSGPSTKWLYGFEGHNPDGSTNGFTCISTDGSTNKCIIDSLQDTIAADTGNRLNYDTVQNIYTYSTPAGYQNTIFTRTVAIINPVGANAATAEAQVIVTVTWHDIGNAVHTVTVKENLFNWE